MAKTNKKQPKEPTLLERLPKNEKEFLIKRIKKAEEVAEDLGEEFGKMFRLQADRLKEQLKALGKKK